MALNGAEAQRVGTIWSLSLDKQLPVIQPQVKANFCRLGPESIGELTAAVSGSLTGADASVDAAEFRQRFETGRHCYAARVSGRLAAYGWVSFDAEYVGELGLCLTLLPCEAYIWDCVTLPDFRRKHLYSALLVYIIQALRSEPLSRVWIGADMENQPSQRGIDQAGFLRIADLALGSDPHIHPFEILGYPGIPGSLVAEARRVFLGSQDAPGEK